MNMDWNAKSTNIDTGLEFLSLALVVSTLVLGSVWLFNITFRRVSSAQRFASWQGAFVGLLFLPCVFVLFPTIPLGIGVQLTQDLNVVREDLPVEIKLPDALSMNSSNTSPANHPLPHLNTELVPINEYFPSDSSVDTESNVAQHSFVSWGSTPSLTPYEILALVWLSVALLLNVRLLVSVCNTYRGLEPSLVPFTPLCRAIVPVYLSQRVSVPVVYGLLRPRIVLPIEAERWSDEELEMSLAHETAHIQRGDLRTQIIVSLVTNFLWFQPLAWMGQAIMRQLREQACDDEVLEQGTLSYRYAEILLTMACRFSNKKIPGGLIVAMAQKPIELRLRNILNPTASRKKLTWPTRIGLLGTCIGLTAMAATIRPFEAPAATVSDSIENQNKSEVKTALQEELTSTVTDLPEFLQGRVLDHEGKPIANCTIEARILTFPVDASLNRTTEHVLPVVTTDQDGFYRLKTAGIQCYDLRCTVIGHARVAGHPDSQLGHILRGPEYALPVIKFRRGRAIQGRLVAATGGPELQNPSIGLIGDGVGNFHQNWVSTTIECKPDGSFKTWVPVAGRVELTAYADNYAPKVVQLTKDVETLDLIELNSGTEVFGTVKDRDDKPVVGVALILERRKSNRIKSMPDNALFAEPKRIVKTNAEGQFRFPPMHGPCSLYLSKGGDWSANTSQLIYSDHKLPLIPPVQLELSPETNQQQVNLKEAKTAILSGHVRWDNGKPVENVKVQLGISNGNWVPEISSTLTDDQGLYKIEVPVTEEFSSISISGRRGIDGKSYQAHPVNDKGVASQPSHQTFSKIEGDLSNVDWEFRSESPSVGVISKNPFVKREKTDADLTLAEIARSYFQQMSPDEVPDHKALENELFKFEQNHRGEHAAVVALRYLLINSEDSQLKQQVAQIIDSHYIENSFIDCCAESLIGLNIENGNFDATILDKIRTENPDKLVRAATNLTKLTNLANVLYQIDFLEDRNWEVDFLAQNNSVSSEDQKNELKQLRSYVALIRRFDAKSLREQSREIINLLRTEFKDLELTHYAGGGIAYIGGVKITEGMITLERCRGDRFQTYGNCADLFDFKLNQLQVGRRVPELDAKNLDGKPIRFDDYLGKLVLVYLANPRQSDYPKRQQQLDKLRKKFNGKLELVGIYHCASNADVLDTLADRQIAWPVVLDGNDGPIYERWSKNGLGETFLIDGDGIIRKELSLEEDIEAEIQTLLAN